MPIVKNTMTRSLNKLTSKLVDVPKKTWKFFRAVTPKDTGNAKNKTKLKGSTIVAKYKYASYLDKGSSKQAPKGMSNPTKIFLDKLMKHIMRK